MWTGPVVTVCYSELIFFFIQEAQNDFFMNLQEISQDHMLHFPVAKSRTENELNRCLQVSIPITVYWKTDTRTHSPMARRKEEHWLIFNSSIQ